MSVLTALSMTIWTMAFAVTGFFGGAGGGSASPGSSPQKADRSLKKRLDKLADALKWLTRKAVKVLPTIVENIAGAVLTCFLGNAVGFVAENKWALIIFVEVLIGLWLMQKSKT